MSKEILRKSIHFLGVFYLPLYVFTGKDFTLMVVCILTLLAILTEVLRRKYPILPLWILHPYEIKGVGAYVYFGVAALILTAFLSLEAAIAGVIIGSVGDGVSGLVKAYQRSLKPDKQSIKLPFILMFLSSLLFFLFVLFAMNLSMKLSFDLRVLALACLIGASIEAKPVRVRDFYINDNLTVPLFSGLFYQLFS